MRTVTDRLGIQALLIDETLPENAHPLYFHQREIPPGTRSHPPHVHETLQVEVMYVLDGEAEVQLDDERIRLSTGMAAQLNCSRLHGILNVGDRPLRYLVIIADRHE